MIEKVFLVGDDGIVHSLDSIWGCLQVGGVGRFILCSAHRNMSCCPLWAGIWIVFFNRVFPEDRRIHSQILIWCLFHMQTEMEVYLDFKLTHFL